MKNSDEYKKMYKFAFNFSRDKSFKNLQTETALAMWESLLAGRCKYLSDWIEFIQTEK
jgi:hypothetical protein